MNFLVRIIALVFYAGVAHSAPPATDDSSNAKPAITEPSTATVSPDSTSETAPGGATERLLASPPKDWELTYQFNNGSTRIAEFTSRDGTATKTTFESHARLVDLDPIEVLLAEVRRESDLCSFVQNFNVFSGLENGYETSARLIMCGGAKPDKRPKNRLNLPGEEDEAASTPPDPAATDEGEVSLYKAIKGNEYLYVISVSRKVEPFEIDNPSVTKEDIASWSLYLSHILVCDTASPEHSCTSPETRQ